VTGKVITVSAVIPTKNRPKELHRLLASLRAQTFPLKEIIVVDAGDTFNADYMHTTYADLPLKVLRSSPSVCRQRNIGIQQAGSEFVFVCDDDMEVPPEYIAAIVKFLDEHPNKSIVTGMVAEKGTDGLFRDIPRISNRRLIWNFLFMLGIWCDLRDVSGSGLAGLIVLPVKRWFLRRGNAESPAGWPVVGSIQDPSFETRFFGLGASVIRRDLLLRTPYDESLGEAGIGDNYDMALRLAPNGPITVLTRVRCLHHRTSSGRLSASAVYLERILALNSFRQSAVVGRWRRKTALLWSLFGNLIAFALHGNGEFVSATWKAMTIISSGKVTSENRSGRRT